MEASSGDRDRKPTSWTARIIAPLLLLVVAAAIVLIVSGTLDSSGDSSSEGSNQASGGSGCQPDDAIRDAAKKGYYVVEEGDNFTTIAERTCVAEDKLQELNPNLDPFGLQVLNCVDLVPDGCKSAS